MARKYDIKADLLGQVARLKLALENAAPLMKQLGALGVETSQKAFEDQALGGYKWPARYEGMDDPFINIAGALQDWNSGRANPKPNRFQDRPALVDEGMRGGLWGSITSAYSPTEALWGSNKEYAALHQEGGVSTQPITETAKKAIRKWLYRESKLRARSYRKSKVTHHGRSGKGQSVKTDRAEYAKHVEPLIYMDEWTQNVAARPFLGITDDLEKSMIRAVESYFTKRQQPGGA